MKETGLKVVTECRMAALWYEVAVTWWAVPKGDAYQIWQVLTWAQADRAHRFWQWCAERTPSDVALFRARWTPKQVCLVLDALVDEARLSRKRANAFQESVLKVTTATGGWQEHTPSEKGRLDATHASVPA